MGSQYRPRPTATPPRGTARRAPGCSNDGGCAADAWDQAVGALRESGPLDRILVLEFGGTSVAEAAAIGRVAHIVGAASGGARPVVVTSALSGVTDGLLAAVRTASAGDADAALSMAEGLLGRHREIAESMPRADGRAELGEALERAAGRVPVLGGFIGSTLEGATTTIGRGGSDHSAVDDPTTLPAITAELARLGDVLVEEDCATVCVVGEGRRGRPGVAGRAFGALGGINVALISQGASSTNLTFAVAGADAAEAVTRLHAAFFGG